MAGEMNIYIIHNEQTSVNDFHTHNKSLLFIQNVCSKRIKPEIVSRNFSNKNFPWFR